MEVQPGGALPTPAEAFRYDYTCVVLAARLVQAAEEGIRDPGVIARRLEDSAAAEGDAVLADYYRGAARYVRLAIADVETARQLAEDSEEPGRVAIEGRAA